MGVSLKPDHLRRYRDIATLFLKYGRADILATTGLDGSLADSAEGDDRGALDDTGRRLARDLEKRGPTFVKMGQLLSTRPDLVCPGIAEALGRLQDDVEPIPFADVERVVQQELGVRLSKAFLEFDRVPLAAASLGQVHRAALRDGRQVAVKVQRPGVRGQVMADLETLDGLARFLEEHTDAARRYDVHQTVAEFRRALLQELDYRREAQHQMLLGRALSEFEHIVVPQPVDDYTTSRVLTMDFIHGQKITALSPVVRLEADGAALAEELVRAYLHQIIIGGFFHADPHPGNVFLTSDNRLALIDLGMVSHLQESVQEQLLKLLLAVAEGHGERAAEAVLHMGRRREGADEEGYRREVTALVAQHQTSNIGELQAGRTLMVLARLAADHGIRLPQEMALLGKTLLNLDEIARTLAPEFKINEVVRDNAADLLERRMLKSLSPAGWFASAIEMKDLAQRLPGRVNRLLDALTNQQLRVKVEMIDEGAVIDGLQKVANRITLGLLIAALIVAAGLLMRVPTDFRLLGYPGLAMIFFLAAAAGATWLAFTIVMHDRSPRHRV
jgi:predicted unusual protein kinase regulating ubiquinone biosynthesis (AarF/ABC1/UbiB family)